LHGNWNLKNKPQTKEAHFQNSSQVIKEPGSFMRDNTCASNVQELEHYVLIHGTKLGFIM
jgi:hypothetical protein